MYMCAVGVHGGKAKADSMRALQSVGRRKGRGGGLDVWKEASAEPRIEEEKTAAQGEVERRGGDDFRRCCCWMLLLCCTGLFLFLLERRGRGRRWRGIRKMFTCVLIDKAVI